MKRRRSDGAREVQQQGRVQQCGAADATRANPDQAVQLCTNADQCATLCANGSATSAVAVEATSVECEMAQLVHQNQSVPRCSPLDQHTNCNLLFATSIQQALSTFSSALDRLRLFQSEHALGPQAAVQAHPAARGDVAVPRSAS